MTKKHVVSQEVADAIESIKNFPLDDVIRIHLNDGFTRHDRQVLNQFTTGKVVEMFLYGVEVEKPVVTYGTVNDSHVDALVKEFERRKNADMWSYRDGVNDGITLALGQLNITVEGIND